MAHAHLKVQLHFLTMESRLEEKSVEDICDWLELKGFSVELVESFRGKYLHRSTCLTNQVNCCCVNSRARN